MTSVRPQPGTARPYDFPAVERGTLANGLRVLVAPMPRLPIVTVLALVESAGAVHEPRSAEGVASLTARALTEGAAGLDGAALASRLEGLGTSIVADAEWDSTAVQLTVTTDRLDRAFPLFAEVVRAPAFPERDLLRLRDERLATIAQQLAEPRGLADERFDAFLYAPSARYARAAAGSSRSVGPLDASVVRRFHERAYGPATTTLIVVGAITPQRAVALAEAGFGGWRREVPATTTAAAVDATRGGRRRGVIVAKADAPQSELRIGHAGVPRQHPDHLDVVVMNAILGGLFSSRINLNLRERHAFTYGASSLFDWRRGAGPFVVSTAVKSDVTGRAVEEVLAEIGRIREEEPSAAEVALATEYLAGVFPIRYETTAVVAAALARASLFGLGEEWFREYRRRVRGVTAARVLGAARRHLDPAQLLVLAVGDPAAVEGPLRQAGVGGIAVVAAEKDPSEEE